MFSPFSCAKEIEAAKAETTATNRNVLFVMEQI
jgi:hypothetical protein